MKSIHEFSLNESKIINEAKGDFAGWIAGFNNNTIEITKDEANGIAAAKQIAITKLKVPKSKQGLLWIKPAVDESVSEESDNQESVSEASNKFTITDDEVADIKITSIPGGTYRIEQAGDTIYLNKSTVMQLSGMIKENTSEDFNELSNNTISEAQKPLSYYKYETPKINILWNGKIQPLGGFKTAEEAKNMIDKLKEQGSGVPINKWQIKTPDGVLDI